MKKYLQIIKGTIEEYLVYRLSFILWRVRMVMQLLVIYFLWWAIFASHKTLFGYTQGMMLTYILLSAVMRPFIMGTRTQEVGSIINEGDLSNYLLRPLNFLRYYVFADIADKALNVFFAIFEIILLYLLLRPPIFIQTNPAFLLLTVMATFIGAVLFFYFSMMLSYLAFWTPDVWAPRFLSFVLIEFFAGMLFPLDILPKPLFYLSTALPFSYFIYFPLKVYLGQLNYQVIAVGLAIGFTWMFGLQYLTSIMWRKGLRVYTAEGR